MPFSEGLACALSATGWVVIDRQGQECFTMPVGIRDGFSEGIALLKDRSSHCWFIDRNGKNAGLGTYEDAHGFNEGLAAVKKAGLWGFIDHKGAIAVPFQFKDALWFSEGRAAVRIDDSIISKPVSQF
jgi:WG containing repeat